MSHSDFSRRLDAHQRSVLEDDIHPDDPGELHEWEEVEEETFRMRVPGGWLYQFQRGGDGEEQPADNHLAPMTFVPFPPNEPPTFTTATGAIRP